MLRAVSIDSDDPALRRLKSISEEIVIVEQKLWSLRARRDDSIRSAVERGATERQSASAAQVAPSYAHLASKHGRFARAVVREQRGARRTRQP
jgi:hypothetical protein